MTIHNCYACDERNPYRIVTYSDGGWTVESNERFVGPPGRVHGGITIGALTCPALLLAEQNGMINPVVKHVTGRLNLPAPLSKSVQVVASSENGRYHIQLLDESMVVLECYINVIDKKTVAGSFIQEIPSELIDNARAISEIADVKVEGPSLYSKLAEVNKEHGLNLQVGEYGCFGCGETKNSLKLSHKVARRVIPGLIVTVSNLSPMAEIDLQPQ